MLIDPKRQLRHKLNNRLQSLLLIIGMTGLLGLLGWIIAGYYGLLWSITLCLIAFALGSRVSPRIVLRMYHAREIPRWQAPGLYSVLEELAHRGGLSHVPHLYYVPTQVLNAFAVGSGKEAAIALTDGLLRTLNPRELAGVLAHEISHVRHNDIWVMSLVDVVSRITLLLSQLGQLLLILMLPMMWLAELPIFSVLIVLLILIAAPLISSLLQLALSRTREYDADLSAVELTGDPQGLACALDKLERYQGGWLERIFMPGRQRPDIEVLRTHPPTKERIRRLLSLVPDQFDSAPYLHVPSRQFAMIETLPAVIRRPRWHLNGLWY